MWVLLILWENWTWIVSPLQKVCSLVFLLLFILKAAIVDNFLCMTLHWEYITFPIVAIMCDNFFFRYSMENIFSVVADVDDYKNFVPWCRNSSTFARKPGHFKAKICVGFPPLLSERYTSIVTVVPPNLVKVIKMGWENSQIKNSKKI